MNRKMLFLLALAIPLLTMGAGCASLSTTTPVTVPTASTPDPSLTPTASTVTVAPTPSSDGMRTLVAAESDATWVLYTNKALGYIVNTPTKGKYTPNWDMKYVDQSDPHIINGCYFNIIPIPKNVAASDTVVVPDGTKFCHIKNEFGDPPSFFVVDDYATAVGKKFIVIEFTKVTTDASVFVAADYQKTLDGIMGTFQMNTAPTPVATTLSKDLEKIVVSEKVVAEKTVVGPRDKMKITQLCDGSVIENGTTKYCLGKNTLIYGDSSRTTIIASETITEGNQEPPILLGVYVVSSVTDMSRILISYKTDTCLTSNKDCPEISMPSDNVVHYNIVFNIGDMTIRQIANYPVNGTAVWNAPGTHALFIKDTCGEGGCNKSGIIGYDLDHDIAKSVTTEQAVGGNYPAAETKMFGAHWKSVMWKSDTKFTATLVNPDSTEKIVNGTF